MTTVKIRMQIRGDEPATIVPVVIPEINEVKAFASELHTKGKLWSGEVFNWPAEYNPEQSAPPPDSKMTFTPADFCIGESGIWFYSLMWENGKDQEPVEFLDDNNVIEPVS